MVAAVDAQPDLTIKFKTNGNKTTTRNPELL